MTKGKVRITGMDELLDMLSNSTRKKVMKRANKLLAVKGQKVAASYPPVPPLSTYRRTGTLGRRWAIRRAEAAGASIDNPTQYASYVQGSESQQAQVHDGVWKTDMEIAKEAVKDYGDYLEKSFEKITGEKVR